MRVLFVAVLLGACGARVPAEPRDARLVAAEASCAPQVDADPVVREIRMKMAGNELYKYEHDQDLAAARARALRACVGGGSRGGGVERQRVE